MMSHTLLLVEDSPADIELVKEVLVEFENDIELKLAKNGVEALEYLERAFDGSEEVPDLILLDLDMPKMDGFEVLERIKENKDYCVIPAAVFTMSNAREDIMRAYRAGANCCITKPLGFEDFNQIMQALDNFWFEVVNLPK
jgi:CheY-like chemotaxis protein